MSQHNVYRFIGFIGAEKRGYPVRLLCQVLGVSHSAFYTWLAGGRARAEQRVRDHHDRAATAKPAWAEHRCVYGARA